MSIVELEARIAELERELELEQRHQDDVELQERFWTVRN